MKKFLFAVASFYMLSTTAQVKYSRAIIAYDSKEQLEQLSHHGIAIDHAIFKSGNMLETEISKQEIDQLRKLGFDVTIRVEDLKEHFLRLNKSSTVNLRNISCDDSQASITYETPQNFNLGSMGGYFTYQEVLDELDQMHSLYPNLITSRENVGDFLTEGQPDTSVTPSIGGNALQWVRISDNPTTDETGEPEVLYTSIHHAREPMSLSQLIFYMWYLLENYDSDDEIKDIVDQSELYFIPVVNPDGYLYNQKTDPNGGGFWRKNRKNNGNGSFGVDNNRNYDYYINGNPANGVWGGQGASSDGFSETYHGVAPFSEVENQAIKWFVEQHEFVFALNNHSFSELLLYPYGYANNVPTPEDTYFEEISELMVQESGYANIISAGLYPAAGDSDDFMYGTVNTHNKIYAFTPEIGDTFWPSSSRIEPIAKEMMFTNITTARLAHNYAEISIDPPSFIGNALSFEIPFELKRLGAGGQGDFAINITPLSNNIETYDGQFLYTGLNPLETVSGTVSITLDQSIAVGDEVLLNVEADYGWSKEVIQVSVRYGELSIAFEELGEDLAVYDQDGWSTTSSTFVSPSTSITDSPNGDYGSNEDKTIALSDPIDLTEATLANVSFFARWDIENDWDYVQFEVSTDNGQTWQPQCGKFTNAGSSNQPTGEPLYDGTQTNWVEEEISLSDYVGEQILLRFHLISDNIIQGDGFYFDDLRVNVLDNTVLSTPDLFDQQFKVYPNPMQDQLTITKNTSEPATITLTSLSGKQILQQVIHNSTVLDTSALAAGVYFLTVVENNQKKVFKLIK
ncbi:hypothetical protein GCM10009117_10340 [Gangjinia marincola]|uniref:Peptidase M14 domain-containing protein n=1 Tax=Gangjinia marincola TaxID=578463 RepID=A0ABP3XR98_9FLAO